MQKGVSAYRSTYVLAVAIACCGLGPFLMGGCPGGGGGGGNVNDNTDNTNGNDNTGNTNGNENTNGNVAEKAFAGAAVCQTCHADKHSDWSETAHAGALTTLNAIGQGANADCLPCHTVGFGETDGFVDEATTPGLAGVQCENCHGAAGEHTRNVGDESKRPTVNMSATLCGGCHTTPHHPTFDEWQLSKHATALGTLQANTHAQDSCLECHSQDYRHVIDEQAEGGGDGDVLPTVATAQLSIVCATCHDPHGGVAQAKLLRLPIADLCGQCHTQEEATVGDSPHHPQFEMAKGTGAYEDAGGPLTVPFSPHASLFIAGGQACAQCHVVQHTQTDPTEDNPSVTGHTFNPFDDGIAAHQAGEYEGCLMCHGTAEVAGDKRTTVQGEVTARLEALAPFFDATSTSYIDPTTLSEADATKLSTAKFDYEFVNADGSRGVHNAVYAIAALTVAEGIVASLTAP
jgi:predicted CXXCH cytochrome family protein